MKKKNITIKAPRGHSIYYCPCCSGYIVFQGFRAWRKSKCAATGKQARIRNTLKSSVEITHLHEEEAAPVYQYGEVREDGYIFVGYKSNGYPCFLSPLAKEGQRKLSREWHRANPTYAASRKLALA